MLFRSDVSITVEVDGEFSLSVHDSIDRDYVPIDSLSVTKKTTFDSKILVTVRGEFSGEFDDSTLDQLEVEDVEIVSIPNTINFGTLEPFQDEHE